MTSLFSSWRSLSAFVILASSCTSSLRPTTSAPPPTRLTSATTPQNLTLPIACALSLQHHPSLATYPLERRAADARILQATRSPNPELSFDAEDFFGSGGVSGLSAAVLNSIFTQVIERGGKKQARTEKAQSEGEVMNAEYEQKRLAVIRETSERYIEASAAHENLVFLNSALKRSKETKRITEDLYDAGRATQSTLQQAELEVQKMELELNAARQDLRLAAKALGAQWGDSGISQFRGSGLAAPTGTLASPESLRNRLPSHPRIAFRAAQVQQAEAELKLAQAGRFQDLTLFGGARQNRGTDETSALGGFSIPLPFSNSGKDAVVEMTALVEVARTEFVAEKRALELDLARRLDEARTSQEQAKRVEKSLLPVANELFRNAEESFRAGKITSLEYLAASQQFHTIRRQWLEARRDYHLSLARLQEVTPQKLTR